MLGGASSPAMLAVLTMWPSKDGSALAASSIMGVNSRTPWITPQRLTPSTHCQSSSVFSQTSPPAPTPALLNTKCGAPNCWRTSSARACIWAASDTSTRRASTRTPCPSNSAAALSSASCCTSTSTRFMPSFAPMRAHSRPKPEPAPVSTAVLPLKFLIIPLSPCLVLMFLWKDLAINPGPYTALPPGTGRARLRDTEEGPPRTEGVVPLPREASREAT
ncbi:MAG: hypothetical protein GAK34_03073 [Delftia tsuruhatensis]|nr:MAG: hypothetical protein GAK34_03073 [Delftia tsuruhatensis]